MTCFEINTWVSAKNCTSHGLENVSISFICDLFPMKCFIPLKMHQMIKVDMFRLFFSPFQQEFARRVLITPICFDIHLLKSN